ncbi:MAG: hypothetical protein A6F71_06365 [Cycloclasticus sp. symbiont of Poecilosclerida sp. M]|nr:MAG: hypothetical protein A6F71_06365 [Cycloclasticus sp. symbiont of Poecilosclerida sp. M]
MDSQNFGLLSMLAFWASAIGGVFLAVQWAKRKSKKNPAPRDVIIKSLKKRLDEGEITQAEYEQRLKAL